MSLVTYQSRGGAAPAPSGDVDVEFDESSDVTDDPVFGPGILLDSTDAGDVLLGSGEDQADLDDSVGSDDAISETTISADTDDSVATDDSDLTLSLTDLVESVAIAPGSLAGDPGLAVLDSLGTSDIWSEPEITATHDDSASARESDLSGQIEMEPRWDFYVDANDENSSFGTGASLLVKGDAIPSPVVDDNQDAWLVFDTASQVNLRGTTGGVFEVYFYASHDVAVLAQDLNYQILSSATAFDETTTYAEIDAHLFTSRANGTVSVAAGAQQFYFIELTEGIIDGVFAAGHYLYVKFQSGATLATTVFTIRAREAVSLRPELNITIEVTGVGA